MCLRVGPGKSAPLWRLVTANNAEILINLQSPPTSTLVFIPIRRWSILAVSFMYLFRFKQVSGTYLRYDQANNRYSESEITSFGGQSLPLTASHQLKWILNVCHGVARSVSVRACP